MYRQRLDGFDLLIISKIPPGESTLRQIRAALPLPVGSKHGAIKRLVKMGFLTPNGKSTYQSRREPFVAAARQLFASHPELPERFSRSTLAVLASMPGQSEPRSWKVAGMGANEYWHEARRLGSWELTRGGTVDLHWHRKPAALDRLVAAFMDGLSEFPAGPQPQVLYRRGIETAWLAPEKGTYAGLVKSPLPPEGRLAVWVRSTRRYDDLDWWLLQAIAGAQGGRREIAQEMARRLSLGAMQTRRVFLRFTHYGLANLFGEVSAIVRAREGIPGYEGASPGARRLKPMKLRAPAPFQDDRLPV